MMWRSPTACQPAETLVVAVAGVAGSGKSTLGRALAASLWAPLLDLDTLTNPLLDRLPWPTLSADGGHWLASPFGAEIRDGRYAALRAVARDVVGTAGCVVLVAPFTDELRGGESWRLLREAVGDVRVVHLAGDDELFAARRAGRAEIRDRHRVGVVPQPPGVPVISIEAELTTDQQLLRVLAALGRRTPVEAANGLFARTFDAVLFDLDGTLVDSTASVLRSWRRFAADSGVPAEVVAENHGRPARDLIGLLMPPDRAAAGLDRITDLEIGDVTSVVAALGALDFYRAVPETRRAVVTSGSTRLAKARLSAAGLPPPSALVTADDVRKGKPDPEPYLAGAARMETHPGRCLAVEDTVAGIRSARAAGCAVLAVTGTTCADELTEADLVVDGLDRLGLDTADGVLRLSLLS